MDCLSIILLAVLSTFSFASPFASESAAALGSTEISLAFTNAAMSAKPISSVSAVADSATSTTTVADATLSASASGDVIQPSPAFSDLTAPGIANLAVVQGSGVCSLNQRDTSSWSASGATDLMQNWFNANGTEDWLTKMDEAFGQKAGDQSTLDCRALDGTLCPPPQTSCAATTPNAYHFVRLAATNAHDFFTAAHTQLQDEVIMGALNVVAIVNDFALPAPDIPMDAKAVVAGVFGVLSGLTAEDAAFSGAFAAIGGVFSIASALHPPDDPKDRTNEFEADVQSQLARTFDNARTAIEGTNRNLFSGNLSFFDNIISTSDGHNAITEIFSTGAFLVDEADSPLPTSFHQGVTNIKQSLVSGLMLAQNFYVFINTQVTSDQCNIFGSRFINNECLIISTRVPGSGGTGTQPVPQSILTKLDDPNAGYNVDLVEMYQNMLDCGSGQLDTSVTSGETLPKCFWSLPIVRADGPSICSAIPDGLAGAQNLAAGVQLTLANC